MSVCGNCAEFPKVKIAAVNCPPRLPHFNVEFAGLDFIFSVVCLGKRVVRGALKLFKRSARFSRCLVSQR